ncbi:MAG: hypothetical protein M3011_03500 [Actinomycetota bacterium]|nr:hypothetical protein [Actinomycetota bacterium]
MQTAQASSPVFHHQVLVVLADELDDQATYARLWRALDVDTHHRPPPPDRRANAGV